MSTDESLSNPGIHYPPPFIYVAGIVLGWLVHRLRPLPITDGPSVLRFALAFVCAIAWLLLFGAAWSVFRRERTTLIPNRPATALATTGIYSRTRNPMYLSLAILYIAVTLVLDSWWPLLLLPAVLAIIDRVVILREERYLSKAFPQLYDEYRRRVRRWL
jgi:protein-S-isoprenylcysteine O-methyltransferase Ste14